VRATREMRTAYVSEGARGVMAVLLSPAGCGWMGGTNLGSDEGCVCAVAYASARNALGGVVLCNRRDGAAVRVELNQDGPVGQATARNASTALVPPKANEFDNMVRPAAPTRAPSAT